MSKFLRIALMCVALSGACAAQPALACPMCKIAQEDSTDPAVRARPRAYMYSILFMISMPATLVTSFGVAFYRMSQKQAALNAAELAKYGLGPGKTV